MLFIIVVGLRIDKLPEINYLISRTDVNFMSAGDECQY